MHARTHMHVMDVAINAVGKMITLEIADIPLNFPFFTDFLDT